MSAYSQLGMSIHKLQTPQVPSAFKKSNCSSKDKGKNASGFILSANVLSTSSVKSLFTKTNLSHSI